MYVLAFSFHFLLMIRYTITIWMGVFLFCFVLHFVYVDASHFYLLRLGEPSRRTEDAMPFVDAVWMPRTLCSGDRCETDGVRAFVGKLSMDKSSRPTYRESSVE